MADWHTMGPFTVFDLETTGLIPSRDRIVEIGAVRIDKDGSLSRFTTLINPGVAIPPRARSIHGISDEMVATAPNFTQAGYQFLDFAKGSHLVTHNARFDLAFMQENLARAGLPLWKEGAFDSVTLLRKAFPHLPAYNLQAVRVSLHLPDQFPGEPHRAMFDAEVTMCAFIKAMDQLSEFYTVPSAAESENSEL